MRSRGQDVVGIDISATPWTTHVASVTDRSAVRDALDGVDRSLETSMAQPRPQPRICVRCSIRSMVYRSSYCALPDSFPRPTTGRKFRWHIPIRT
ncbi:hypothetical protein QMK17_20165 [Rhodococcus sp. G-MC3]|nr:hypothetical protein [Rhodococcus sp. G-MC3]MDJ0395640.1 hypothetical protein [Rhodococcus sp. G-MC3]